MDIKAKFLYIRVNPNNIEKLRKGLHLENVHWMTPRDRQHLVKGDFVIFTNVVSHDGLPGLERRLYTTTPVAVYHESLFRQLFEVRRNNGLVANPLIPNERRQ